MPRRRYLALGYSSLFTYCTRCLHLSEHAAYGRIEAARIARRFPIVLELLAAGSITLTTLSLLASHLTEENHRAVLEAALNKSKRQVEQQVAALAPKPNVRSGIRRLPQSTSSASVSTPTSIQSSYQKNVTHATNSADALTAPPVRNAPLVIAPLAPERYKVQLTIDRGTLDKFRRVQDLLRHVVPDGDPAIIFNRALTALLADLERRKLCKVERPRPTPAAIAGGRDVPAAIKREVWARDGGRCAFAGTHGRCEETGFLELHHVVPFAEGGPTTADNLQLRCRAHNAHEAKEHFGPILFRERSIGYELGPELVDRWHKIGADSVPSSRYHGQRSRLFVRRRFLVPATNSSARRTSVSTSCASA